ncbi:MAG: DUF4160 domain-containing protein [Verrucomicrobia bacterium]|jgi:hypothetical protein|nr:DUF4160 domain-containing protein [Verrucomicrobiota bacterium]
MPVLAKFYGVVVRMLFAPLLGAHFYAIYGDHELVVRIGTLKIIQGDAPEDIKRLVLAWARRHQTELLDAWRLCQRGARPQPIGPLV